MIQMIFGLPGKGKTTTLTAAAMAWQRGESFLGIPPNDKIFTNFECPGCYKLEFEWLGLYDTSNSNIIIDEIMLFADCRNFKSFPEHLKKALALHRHGGTNYLICSQYWDDCDKKFRVLTQQYFLLDRLPCFPISVIKPIKRNLGPRGGKMQDGYDFEAPIKWQFIYLPKYYKLFDSFELEALPPMPSLDLWAPRTDKYLFRNHFLDLSYSPVWLWLQNSGLLAWDHSPVLRILSRICFKLSSLRRSRPA